ncbi:MAG: L-seryl-tRNA(Sec) selenium transferase [Anaerolineaceae bacterium]
MSSLRQIPSVDHVLTHPLTEDLIASYGREWTTEAIRQTLNGLRENIQEAQPIPSNEILIKQVAKLLQDQAAPTLQPVINATGVLLHTNLGRTPLSQAALRAMQANSAGYSSLEYNLQTGKRGQRDMHAEARLVQLTGAEAALVVNNNAGAVMLTLTALARRKKVAISRSQLVEIGGGFRIPDVLRESGAKLLEIGSTNRTHLKDFESAIAEGAGLLLVAHHSNFKIIGFSTEPGLAELANLANAHNLPLVYDLGSGALLDTEKYQLAHEPTVQEALQAGCDLVCFSGDKLLGGPQAGIIVGKKVLVERLRRHPLYRAMRPDKLCLSALSATLLHYLKGEAETQIPLYQMLSRSEVSLHRQVEYWQAQLGTGTIIPGRSTVGGGSLPEETLPTWLLALKVPSAQKFLGLLRNQQPPIVARIHEDRIVFDPRTIQPDVEEFFLSGIQKALLQLKDHR